MKILVTGSTGLVGRLLVEKLREKGHEVIRLVRSKSAASAEDAIRWNPKGHTVFSNLGKIDGVFHLAGEAIATGRWNKAKKERIRNSRVQGTLNLVKSLQASAVTPRVFISASAVGFYGSSGDTVLTEKASRGDGFLAEVTEKWEQASSELLNAETRLVHARIGIVLSKMGGALKLMLPPFKMGLGGPVGGGKQWLSWISLTDLVRALIFCLENKDISGPVNLVGPKPETNQEFTKTLGKVLERPTLIPVPGFAIKTIFGEMGRETILSSIRASSEKLEQADFSFTHQTLGQALREELAL